MKQRGVRLTVGTLLTAITAGSSRAPVAAGWAEGDGVSHVQGAWLSDGAQEARQRPQKGKEASPGPLQMPTLFKYV